MGRRADPENRASESSEQADLPQGVLTFLLTDIEASTPLWERHGAPWGPPSPAIRRWPSSWVLLN